MTGDNDARESVISLESVESPVPRLGIIHLMIWMTVTAVFFWQMRLTFDARFGAAGQPEDSFPQGYLILMQITDAVLSVVAGIAATAVIVLVQRWSRHGGRMLSEPGHWLALGFLVVSMTGFLLGMATAIGLWDWLEVFTFDPRIQSVHAITLAVPAIVYGFGFRQSKTARWKIILALLVTRPLLRASQYLTPWLISWSVTADWVSIYFWMINFVSIGIALAVIVTAIVDALKQDRRDWVHWVGVATEAEVIATTLIWLIGMPFVV